MATTSRQLQRRDKDGLTLQMRNTLQALALESDWRIACASVDVLPATLQSWLQNDEAFGNRYDQLLGPSLEIAKDMMEQRALKAAGMYDEALDAVRTIARDVSCPKCGHTFMAFQTTPDWSARLKAGDTIMKTAGILIDRRKIEQTNVNLSFEQSMALAQVQYAVTLAKRTGGVPQITVSPSMLEQLKRKGAIEGEVISSKVIHDSDGGVQPGA